ncbi:MAG: hypothetical protein KC475_11780 [Cyanobacteria bacterium HKST-UBA03]|nr:hypothetical protein [Cyanobacteria bacterium HKST-UBA03]
MARFIRPVNPATPVNPHAVPFGLISMYHIRRAPSRSFWHKPVGSDELAQAFERHLAQQEQFEPGEAVFDHFLGSAERLRDSQASADVVVVTGPERDTFRALQQTAHRQAKAQAGGDKLADELLYGDQIRASAWFDDQWTVTAHRHAWTDRIGFEIHRPGSAAAGSVTGSGQSGSGEEAYGESAWLPELDHWRTGGAGPD